MRVEVALSGERDAIRERPRELMSLTPEEVFVRRYRKDFEGDVPDELLAAFRLLIDEVERGGVS